MMLDKYGRSAVIKKVLRIAATFTFKIVTQIRCFISES